MFEQTLLQYQDILRLGFFIGIFLLVALVEYLKPRRQQLAHRPRRWFTNLALVAIDSMVVRLMLPMGLIAIALQAKEMGWGLFNLIDSPAWFSFILALILLDLAVYWQHRVFHMLPVLWRLHKVHHSDCALDASTGLRFHPIEIALSILLKLLLVLLLGIPATAIIIFEIVLNAVAMFNHGNIRLPLALDSILRKFIVTPDMHRVHHSNIPNEYNSNFGFNISLWDRFFNSYLAQPQKGHDNIEIGLKEYPSNTQTSSLIALLVMPFKKPKENK